MTYPAYAKQLMELRRAGKRPADTLVVCLDYWPHREPNPHIIIKPEMKIAELELVMLAALPVVIQHPDGVDLNRLIALIDRLLKLDPEYIGTASIDRLFGVTVFDIGSVVMWPWGQWELATWYGWEAVRWEQERENKKCA